VQRLMLTQDLLWPACNGPDDLARIEAVPLTDRALPASTYEVVRRAAQLWPDRPAMSFLPDAERWDQPSTRTFAEFAADVHRVAHVLSGLGVGRRDAVAIVSVNCDQLATALLAAEAVGIAAPINPALDAEHAQHLVELSAARVVVAAGPELDPASWDVARALVARTAATVLLALRPVAAADAAPRLEPLEGATVAYLQDLAAQAPSDGLPVALPAASDLCSYLHTGGTTGRPKLAARTHGNEVSNAWMIAASVPPNAGDVVFAALPLFHTNALLVTMIAPLLRGQHVVWAGPLGYRDLPLFGIIWKLVERYRIASMSGVPTIYAALAQVPVDADVSSLHYPLVGAAPLPPSVAEAFKAMTGASLCEGYGLTEATCASARNFPACRRAGSVGQRLPYQDMRAVYIDGATGEWEPLSAGEVGTIVVKGPNVFAGYLEAGPDGPVPQPGDKVKDGWLDTGDLGSVDADGYVRLTGRAKDLIIRGGHNLDPAVIEDALLEHPAVTAAAAVGGPDAHAGEVPVVYVTVKAAAGSVGADELRSWAAAHVPERAAAPRWVEIIDAIPVTAVGKPFKPELRRRATERAAQEALPEQAAVHACLVAGAVRVEISGVTEDEVAGALASFTFDWHVVSLGASAPT
jgi:fatty-acyl-CoA synthase